MTIAVNDSGDVLSDATGVWKPATRAVNDATGESLVLDGSAWKPMPSPKTAPDMSAQTESPTYAAPASTDAAPGNAAVERIGKAASDAYIATPSFFTPEAQQAIDKYGGPVGQQIVNPAGKLVGGAIGTAHAGMAALSQAAMELFGEKGGRDVLAFASSLPMVAGERMSPNVAEPAEAAPRPQFVAERFAPDVSQLDPRNAIQTLIQHDINENPGASVAAIGQATDIDGAIAAAGKAAQTPTYTSVTAPQVAARDGIGIDAAFGRARAENAAGVARVPANDAMAPGPMPQAVGAAASREGTPPDQLALSNTDMKANRYQAEMNELVAPPLAGDKTVYVPNSLPTLAERSGDPVISQQENLLRQRNPAAFIGEGKRLTENNNARVAEFDNQTPSRTALTMMRDQRNAQWEADSNGILPTAQPVDFTPALDWVQGQLSDPKIHENDAVRNVLEGFRDRLIDEDGEPKTDPAAAWGIHNNIQNQLAKAKDPLNATGAEKYAFSELMQAKAHVDAALNVATDNKFQIATENYAKASQAINAGEELEAFRPNLTNPSGTLMADRFHKFVVDLAVRRGDPGIDPAMNISDETMRSLINIDNDLKRAGLIRLGAAAGSPTNLLGALAEQVGLSAAHSAVGTIPVIGPALKVGADYLGQRRLEALTAKHLAEPEGGYVYQTP